MSNGSTQLGDLEVAVEGAAEALAADRIKGTTFATLPPPADGAPLGLFPAPLAISGQKTLQLGKASLDVGASSSYQVFALTGQFVDPDGIVSPADGSAWLKHELDAAVSESGSEGSGELSGGLDSGATARLLDYRRHAPTDAVADAVLTEMAHPRWPSSIADLQAMAPGDAVALIVSGNVAFRASFTYADLLPLTVAALDAKLGATGAAAFEIAIGATVDVDFSASDSFRLVFTHGTTLDIAVDLKKAKTTSLGANAKLGVTVGLADPAQLSALVESYVAGRLGAPYENVKDLLDKLGTVTDVSQLDVAEQKLLDRLVTFFKLGDAVAKLEDVKSKVMAVPSDLQDDLAKALSEQLAITFTVGYSRVDTDETLVSFEAAASALAPFLSRLLIGDVSGLSAPLAAGAPGFVLNNYLSTRQRTRQVSFGVSLAIGSWAAVGTTTTTVTKVQQENIAHQLRMSLDGRTAYQSKWGKAGENYSFELTAAMPGFASQPAELTLGANLGWMWDQKLTPALQAAILDLANVWGVFPSASNASQAAALAACAGQEVHAELVLTLGDDAVRRLPIIPEPQSQAAWILAMAQSLPRVSLPDSSLAVDIGQRTAIYQGVAAWVFGQKSGAELTVWPDYQRAAPPLAPEDEHRLREIDLPSGASSDDNTTVYSLPALWSPTSSTVNPWHLYQQVVDAFRKLGSCLDGDSGFEVIERVFLDLSAIAEQQVLARLLGSLFAQVLASAGLVSGALTVTPADGGQAIVMTGGGKGPS